MAVESDVKHHKPYPSNTRFVWSQSIGREDPELWKCKMKTISRRIITICLFQNLFSMGSEKGLKQDTISFRVCCKDDSWFSVLSDVYAMHLFIDMPVCNSYCCCIFCCQNNTCRRPYFRWLSLINNRPPSLFICTKPETSSTTW